MITKEMVETVIEINDTYNMRKYQNKLRITLSQDRSKNKKSAAKKKRALLHRLGHALEGRSLTKSELMKQNRSGNFNSHKKAVGFTKPEKHTHNWKVVGESATCSYCGKKLNKQ